MRGARNTLTAASGSSRIIPAYAGSTAATLILVSVLRDHPRVCGEHLWQAVPKAWRTGIIPAYAGSTRRCDLRSSRPGDHPRVCGEHHRLPCRHRPGRRIIPAYAGSTQSRPLKHMRGRGSSPRMRGAPLPHGAAVAVHGIIPAYAGSTRRSRARCCRKRDHPRVCGEHSRLAHSLPFLLGSSPRMRGAPLHKEERVRTLGIIPAYAGSTSAN